MMMPTIVTPRRRQFPLILAALPERALGSVGAYPNQAEGCDHHSSESSLPKCRFARDGDVLDLTDLVQRVRLIARNRRLPDYCVLAAALEAFWAAVYSLGPSAELESNHDSFGSRQRRLLALLLAHLECGLFEEPSWQRPEGFPKTDVDIANFGLRHPQINKDDHSEEQQPNTSQLFVGKYCAGRVPRFISASWWRLQILLRQHQHIQCSQSSAKFATKRQVYIRILALASSQLQASPCLWVFAAWKVLFMNIIRVYYEYGQSPNGEVRGLHLVLMAWRLAIVDSMRQALRTRDGASHELENLRDRLAAARMDRNYWSISLLTVHQNIEIISNDNVAIVKLVEDLKSRLDGLRPCTTAAAITTQLPIVLELLTRLAGVTHHRLRAELGVKDLFPLTSADGEVSTNMNKLTIDHVLVRWINHLLEDFQMRADEILHSSRNDDDSHWQLWPTKEHALFAARMREARSVNLVKNLGEELSDGKAITGLCACIHAFARSKDDGRVTLHPRDLWPIDHNTCKERVSAACSCLRAIAPTQAAANFLKDVDVYPGNAAVQRKFFAAMFLKELPGLMDFHGLGQQRRGSAWTYPAQKSQQVGVANAGNKELAFAVGTMLEKAAETFSSDAFVDIALLTHGQESVTDLSLLSGEDILKRWLQFHTGCLDCEDLGELLSDGTILLRLLKKIAPELVRLGSDIDGVGSKMETSDHARRVALNLVQRCCSYVPVNESMLEAGSSELVGSCLSLLFLSRPALPPSPKSLTYSDFDVLEEVLPASYEAILCGQDWAALRRLIDAASRGKRQRLAAALPRLIASRERAESIRKKMRQYMYECLARAQHTDDSHSSSRNSFSNETRLLNGLTRMERRMWRDVAREEPVATWDESIRNLICTYGESIRDVFKLYSHRVSDSHVTVLRLGLDGLVHLHLSLGFSCPFCCAALALEDTERLYFSLVDSTPASRLDQSGMSINGFIRFLLRVARHRTELQGSRESFELADALRQILMNHLAFSARGSDSTLQRLLFDPAVRRCFVAMEHPLRSIFMAHASLSGESWRITPCALASLLESAGVHKQFIGGQAVRHLVFQVQDFLRTPGRCRLNTAKNFRAKSISRRSSFPRAESPQGHFTIVAERRPSTSGFVGRLRSSSIGRIGRRASFEFWRPSIVLDETRGAQDSLGTSGDLRLAPPCGPDGLSFHEFVIALAAISIQHIPSPFLHVSTRFSRFIVDKLLTACLENGAEFFGKRGASAGEVIAMLRHVLGTKVAPYHKNPEENEFEQSSQSDIQRYERLSLEQQARDRLHRKDTAGLEKAKRRRRSTSPLEFARVRLGSIERAKSAGALPQLSSRRRPLPSWFGNWLPTSTQISLGPIAPKPR